MAVLSDADRAAETARFSRDVSKIREILAVLTKAELRAALNATDDWVEANTAAFNSALPVVARTNLTTKQKAQLLVNVVRRRYEVA